MAGAQAVQTRAQLLGVLLAAWVGYFWYWASAGGVSDGERRARMQSRKRLRSRNRQNSLRRTLKVEWSRSFQRRTATGTERALDLRLVRTSRRFTLLIQPHHHWVGRGSQYHHKRLTPPEDHPEWSEDTCNHLYRRVHRSTCIQQALRVRYRSTCSPCRPTLNLTTHHNMLCTASIFHHHHRHKEDSQGLPSHQGTIQA